MNFDIIYYFPQYTKFLVNIQVLIMKVLNIFLNINRVNRYILEIYNNKL